MSEIDQKMLIDGRRERRLLIQQKLEKAKALKQEIANLDAKSKFEKKAAACEKTLASIDKYLDKLEQQVHELHGLGLIHAG